MSETTPTTISATVPATGQLEFVEAFVERFDGAPVAERRRWSDEFKADAVAAALVPGVNVSALARRLGVTAPQLFGWRKAIWTVCADLLGRRWQSHRLRLS